jgi:hypothetical protein
MLLINILINEIFNGPVGSLVDFLLNSDKVFKPEEEGNICKCMFSVTKTYTTNMTVNNMFLFVK